MGGGGEVLRELRSGGTEQLPHPVFPEAGGLLPWYRHPGPLLRFLAEVLNKEIRVPFFPDDFPAEGANFTPPPAPSP